MRILPTREVPGEMLNISSKIKSVALFTVTFSKMGGLSTHAFITLKMDYYNASVLETGLDDYLQTFK